MSPIMYVLISFIPAGIVAAILEIWRHLNQANDQRLPIKDKLLRPPGETSRRKAEHLNEKIDEVSLWVFGFPITLMICYLSSNSTGPLSRPISGVWLVAFGVAAAVFGVLVWKLSSLYRTRNYWRDSFSAERVVGEQINQLMCDGCRVLHDFPLTDDWNIGHIIIAPSGVYAVETRARHKGSASASQQAHEVVYDGKTLEFPFQSETADLEQARAQSERLAKVLQESLAEPIPVKPVLTLPGWYVITRNAGDVMVLNPKMIDAAIITHAAPVLSPERIKQITQVLDRKSRELE